MIYSTKDNSIVIQNSRFENLQALKGSFLYLSLNLLFQVVLINNTIETQSHFESNAIYLNTISRIYFKNNSFYLKNQSLIISKLSKIYLKTNSIVNLTCIAKFYECFAFLMSSYLVIWDVKITKITSYGLKNIIYGVYSSITIFDTVFSGVRSQANEIIFLEKTNFSFARNYVLNYCKGWLNSIEGVLYIANSSFSNAGNNHDNAKSLKDIFSTLKSFNCEIQIFKTSFLMNKVMMSNSGVSNMSINLIQYF